MSRVPTPEIDRIFSREQTLTRWHRLWVWHLAQQKEGNPSHPISDEDLNAYHEAANRFENVADCQPAWIARIDEEEFRTRHELVAAMNVFTQVAGVEKPGIHWGLTSSDITDVATQWAILDATAVIRSHVAHIIQLIADQATHYAGLIAVARTHGQPAQLTTYGHRQATLLGPLVDWFGRWRRDQYPMRPPHGAVGTAADLMRVLVMGQSPPPSFENQLAELDEYTHEIRFGIGAVYSMLTTRQVYHRSYDLHWAGLLAQLVSIAETWATDRRLEAMLGLGVEIQGKDQIGSSAMPHKNNPRIAERMTSHAGAVYAQLAAGTQFASREWLEGDVAGSALRREHIPTMFRLADRVLCDWNYQLLRWQLNEQAVADDIKAHEVEWCTSVALHELIQAGMPRGVAHKAVSQPGWSKQADSILAQSVAEVQAPLGNVRQQIEVVVDAARRAVRGVPELPFVYPR